MQETDRQDTWTERLPRPRVGLVLGAGGIRGCAHAGVVSILQDAGVPIDLVVGASIGSMIGLGCAAGWTGERLIEASRLATPGNIFRFYTSRLRPGPDNPLARMVYEAGAGKTFADLALPFAVVATDMNTGQPVVFDSGPVLPAIQASIAIPLVARPVALEDGVYVDGGLLETAPVFVARQMGADLVIAVCLGYNYSAPRFLRQRPWTRSILERMGKQRNPATVRLHDQIRFGCRLFAASYQRTLPAQGADIVLWPEFGRIGPNSLFGGAFCLGQGIAAARAALPEILAAISPIAPDSQESA